MLNTWIEDFIVEGTAQFDEDVWGNGVGLGLAIAGAEGSDWNLESLVTALGKDHIDVAVRAAICVKVLIKVYRGVIDIREEEGINELISQFLRLTERIEGIRAACGAMLPVIKVEYIRCFSYIQKKYAERPGILKLMKAAYVIKDAFGLESNIYLLTESEVDMLDSLHTQSDDNMVKLFAKCYEIIMKSRLPPSDLLNFTAFSKLYEFIEKTDNLETLDTIKIMIQNYEPALNFEQIECLKESLAIKYNCQPESILLGNSLLQSVDWPNDAGKYCEKIADDWVSRSELNIRHHEEHSNRSDFSRNQFRNRNPRRYQRFGRNSSEFINPIDKTVMDSIKNEIYMIFDNIRGLISQNSEISLEFLSESLIELTQISSADTIFEILKNRSYYENRSNDTSITLWSYIIQALNSTQILNDAQIGILNKNLNRIERRAHRRYKN